MVFLGTLLDTEKMEIRVTNERMLEIQALLPEWLDKKSATKRQLQSLVGKLQFVGRCVKPSRIFISRILVLLRGLARADYRIRLSHGFKQDIRWWINFMAIYNGVSMIKTSKWSAADKVFSTDSCLTGCGGICENEFFHRVFPNQLVGATNITIVQLECITVMVAIKHWCGQCKGKKISIYCDNEAVCSVINSGKTKDMFLLDCES